MRAQGPALNRVGILPYHLSSPSTIVITCRGEACGLVISAEANHCYCWDASPVRALATLMFFIGRQIFLDRHASLAMTESLFVRPKHIVPEPGGDAEALVVGFEVVRHVVAA